jgi:hypothetical protein
MRVIVTCPKIHFTVDAIEIFEHKWLFDTFEMFNLTLNFNFVLEVAGGRVKMEEDISRNELPVSNHFAKIL